MVQLRGAEAHAKEAKGLLLAYFLGDLAKDPSSAEDVAGGRE